MKRIFSLFILTCLLFSSCSSIGMINDGETGIESNKESVSAESEEKPSYIKNGIDFISAKGTVQSVTEYDYDSDGSVECFVLCGESADDEMRGIYPDMEIADGTLWYVGKNGVEQLTFEDKSWGGAGNITIGDMQMWSVTSCSASASTVYVYYVDGGEPVLSEISGIGSDLTSADANSFTLTVLAYDFGETNGIMCGHTYKPYYFYYDAGERSFHEYGGREITVSQFEKCENADVILSALSDNNYEIKSIIYRENGLIHVNYARHSDTYNYITVRLEGSSLEYGSDFLSEKYEGFYLDSVKPEIAVYPETLPNVFS